MSGTARLASFATIFRQELLRQVEFSLSQVGPEVYGTGIPGVGRDFDERVRQFAGQARYTSSWCEAVARLRDSLCPDSYFFKVDWLEEVARRITIYFRFERALDETVLARAFARSSPLAWEGPPPCLLARAVGQPSPFIIGLRAAEDGAAVAMYYRIYGTRQALMAGALSEVLRLLALPPALADVIRDTTRHVVGFGSPSILGIDSPSALGAAALKVDIAGVLLRDALAFIVRHGADMARAHAFGLTAQSLRVEVLSYCGAKFGADGLSGWKLYLPVRPVDRMPIAARLRIGDDGRQLRGVPW